MLLHCIIIQHQLDDGSLVMHCCNVQCMIPFISCLVYAQLRYAFLLSLMKYLFQNLYASFFCNVMKNSPSITILLIHICTAFQQYLDRLDVLLLIESLYRLQQSKCTEDRFLLIDLLSTRNQKVYNLNISVFGCLTQVSDLIACGVVQCDFYNILILALYLIFQIFALKFL